jgi:hypothetical protein
MLHPPSHRLPSASRPLVRSAIVLVTVSATLGAAAFAAGCGGGSDSSDGGAPLVIVDGGVQVALSPPGPVYMQAFHDFREWKQTPGVGPAGAPEDVLAAADGGPHSFGPMTSYINHVPPPGSTSFPTGTIIVKEKTTGPITSHKIFAMEKRGDGFNTQDGGAANWEWFEVQSYNENDVSQVWRGFGPLLSGDSYGGNPQVCNGCHNLAKDTDFVFTVGFADLLSHPDGSL